MEDRAVFAHAADENERKRWDCSLYPQQSTSPYVLPWRVGEEYLVWQTTDHFARGDGGVGLYAIDVQMRIGTTIVATRAGVVAATRDHFEDGNGRALEENFIFVRHDDGSIARYMHLTREGVMVAEGQSVTQGELLGLSGNTGRIAGPHLHFDVQRCGPNLPPDYASLPCGQTLPITFRNTIPHACGLQPGRSYRALPD